MPLHRPDHQRARNHVVQGLFARMKTSQDVTDEKNQS